MVAKSKKEHLTKSLPGESTTPGATSGVKLGMSKPDPGGVLNMTYAEQLKSPKWQKKRLEIMERDGFKCKVCGYKSNTLNVHHLFYEKGKSVWDYDNKYLTTLCTQCHENIHLISRDALIGIYKVYEKYGLVAIEHYFKFTYEITK